MILNKIIMDTIIEQAHTIHSYNSFRDLAKQGMGKWLFRNQAEYRKYLKDNNIDYPRDLKEVRWSQQALQHGS